MMSCARIARPAVVGIISFVSFAFAPSVNAAKLEVLQPLNRTIYQTNEVIDLSVVRSDASELKAGDLTLTLADDAGSKLAFTFGVDAVPVKGAGATRTEHLHLNGYLLRPGAYTVE